MNETERVRPSSWYYLLAVAFFAGGLGMMIFLFAAGMRRVRDGMARGEIPGQMDLELKQKETYTIFLERASLTNRSTIPLEGGVSCEVSALPNGEAVPSRRPATATSYVYGTRAGVSIFEFSVPHDGVYTVACTAGGKVPEMKLEVAVGGGVTKAISAVVARGFFVLGGGIVVGLLVFVRVTMLRLESRREIREQGLKPV